MTIRVAIAGGGIAGLCLARGLLQYPQFDVQVYEQVQQHRDKGGALALHANAIGAMELIDPAIKRAYFRKANSMLEDDDREMATQVILAEGKHKGEVIARLGRAKGRKTVARVDLINGFMDLVPNENLNMGKRLENIEESDDGEVVLGFADGTTATVDCLIGADGIHSMTRQYLLGRDHPAALPVNHDRWYRVGAKLPMEEVERTLSPRFLGFVPILCGPNGTFNLTPIRYGKTMSMGYYARAQSDEEIGKLPNPADFASYDPDCVKMAELILKAYEPDELWAMHDHDAAPYFNKGRVVMMGDAAHATFPFIGNGAAQAIEDGAVLHALFAHVKDKSEIPVVFAAFDEVRRPRASRVVEMARKAGLMYTYDFGGFWEDSEGIEALQDRWKKIASFTNDVDLETQNQMAISVFQRKTRQRVNGTQ
ncbi:uncharacterized protein PV07_02351 [Cladophialophora immunda]|uniref:FAD-binding domain-containing protein n=1 Tax=Cladophialophora immunda TaxID=569365 RepID=A0A0D2A5L8_9EURO|nr:uncharacterized protein PV07_02351 [Cladophialophora immunda]KIW35666.1 hypothetical protein PV07_02351 [Cladophialophora immunda]OQV04943.1 FAD binding domain-containing protein [Cladophialophora immunda]